MTKTTTSWLRHSKRTKIHAKTKAWSPPHPSQSLPSWTTTSCPKNNSYWHRSKSRWIHRKKDAQPSSSRQVHTLDRKLSSSWPRTSSSRWCKLTSRFRTFHPAIRRTRHRHSCSLRHWRMFHCRSRIRKRLLIRKQTVLQVSVDQAAKSKSHYSKAGNRSTITTNQSRAQQLKPRGTSISCFSTTYQDLGPLINWSTI